MTEARLDEFLLACGATGPLVFEIETPNRLYTLSLSQPFAIIGRGPSVDIDVGGIGPVNECLGYFQILGGQLFYARIGADADRANDNYLRLQAVQHNESIVVGDAKLKLVAGASTSSLSDVAAQPFEITFQEPAVRSWRVHQPLTFVGKSPACQIQLVGDHILNLHAVIVAMTSEIWVISLVPPHASASPRSVWRINWGNRVSLRLGQTLLRMRSSQGRSNTELVGRHSAEVTLPSSAGFTHLQMQQFMELQEKMFAQFRETVLMVMQSFGAIHRDQMDVIQKCINRADRIDAELAELRAQQSQLGQHQLAPRTRVPFDTSQLTPREQSALPTHPVVPPPSSTGPTAATPRTPDVHTWLSQRVSELQAERQNVWTQVWGYINPAKSPPAPPRSG